MGKARFLSFMIVQPAALFLCITTLHAELLDHHGRQADNEGSTAYCMTCHDGSSARKVIVCTTTCTINVHKSMIAYPPPGRVRDFAQQQDVLAAGVKLEDGKIGCISCHDLRNTQKFQFAVDTTPFAKKLCHACHIRID